MTEALVSSLRRVYAVTLSVLFCMCSVSAMSGGPAFAQSATCIEDGGTSACASPVTAAPTAYYVGVNGNYGNAGPLSSEGAIQAAVIQLLTPQFNCGGHPNTVTFPAAPYTWGTPSDQGILFNGVAPDTTGSGASVNATVCVGLTGFEQAIAVTLAKDVTVKCQPGTIPNRANPSANYPIGYCLGTPEVQPPCCSSDQATPQAGDPVEPAYGNKTQVEVDYAAPKSTPIQFVRTYNFQAPGTATSTMGPAWSHTYQRYLFFIPNGVIQAVRADGRVRYFFPQGTGFSQYGTAVEKLLPVKNAGGTLTGYQFVNQNDTVESYDTTGLLLSIKNRAGLTQVMGYSTASTPTSIAPGPGLLISVADDFGHQLALTYTSINGQALISTVTNPGGGLYQYAYTDGVLTSVTYPDSASRSYSYNENIQGNTNIPDGLTGLFDESGTRYATFSWNNSYQVTETSLAGNVGNAYIHPGVTTNTGAGSSTVMDQFGTLRTYTYALVNGVTKFTGSDTLCLRCGDTPNVVAYDTNGNVNKRVDFNGNTTIYAFDLTRNLETSRVEAAGTARARTISTQWNAVWREPAKIARPRQITTFAYDGDSGVSCGGASGSLCTVTVAETTDATGSQGFSATLSGVSRTWKYTYDGYGRTLTVKEPRTDVNSTTTYTYYTCTTGSQCGELKTVTNALGHVTTYNTYNAQGQPLTLTDPNGVVTTLTYDARQRIKSRQVGAETTSFSYYSTGLLKQIALPDGSTQLFTFDAAHRLTQITDALGNTVKYTLDIMGNVTAENAYDPTGVLHRTHTRVINALNEIYQELNAAGTPAVTTTLGYDAQGNLTSVAAPLARTTTNAYDELNRVKQVTDAANGITQLAYDANDHLTSVIDPRNLTTSYTYTGFGEEKTQSSPDTGTTTNTFDSAGNLSTSTDARSAVSTYTYDALNRVTSVAFKIGTSTDQTITFTYDAGTNGKGHLTGASDASHSMSWGYDGLGRVTSKGQTLGTVTKSIGYAYTNADLTSITTPSGQSISYGYNGNHQVTSITLNGATTILNNVTYEPMGPVSGWTWGNGTATTRTYDTDGKISAISSAGTKTLAYDDAFRIAGISDTSTGSANWTYGYDSLDRLTSGTSGSATRGWTYDANGNRKTETGASASTYTISSTSNRISSISGALPRTYGYDAAGHTLSYSTITLTYNDRGRAKTVKNGSVTEILTYNALGQMIETSGGAAGTVIYAYDEAGHLIGEYSSTGALVQETIWLGDTPVATLRPNGATVAVYYVHSDQLNTPRQVTRPSDNKQMWTWFSDPFGTTAVNTNPAGAGTFAYDLRFPGQIYDGEAKLHQNHFRDFDPLTGRYAESDPMGLTGGAVSTYAFVGENPLNGVDRFGLWSTTAHNAIIEEFGRQMGLPPDVVQAMEQGSYNADHGDHYQDAEHAFMHAMSSSALSKEQACKMMNSFVSDSVATAIALFAEGNDVEAGRDLGFGLHAVMDSTSPVHAGFQQWHWTAFWRHGPFPTSREEIVSLTPQLLQQTINKMKDAFEGGGLDCSCYEK